MYNHFQFPDQPFESCFLSTQLNKLIFKLTGLTEFIKPYEMSLNYTGMYTGDPQVAERKVGHYENVPCNIQRFLKL